MMRPLLVQALTVPVLVRTRPWTFALSAVTTKSTLLWQFSMRPALFTAITEAHPLSLWEGRTPAKTILRMTPSGATLITMGSLDAFWVKVCPCPSSTPLQDSELSIIPACLGKVRSATMFTTPSASFHSDQSPPFTASTKAFHSAGVLISFAPAAPPASSRAADASIILNSFITCEALRWARGCPASAEPTCGSTCAPCSRGRGLSVQVPGCTRPWC